MAIVTGTGNADTITAAFVSSGVTGVPGADDDSISGLAGADLLEGGEGNDTLVGGTEADTLRGGGGNDVYLLALADFAGDVIEEAAAGGTDRIDLTNNSVTYDLTGLGLANIETLRASGFNTLVMTAAQINALTLIDGGFAFANSSNLTLGAAGAIDLTGKAVNFTTFSGSSGDDTITSTAANDVLNGLAGADSLLGGDGNDTLNGGTGNDTLAGGLGNDSLNGDADGDVLEGGAGNDTLVGGAGADTLRGGADDDVYLVPIGDLAGDVIEEAPGGGTDRIDLTNNSVTYDLTALSFTGIETLRASGFNTLVMTAAQINALTLIDGGFIFGNSSNLTLSAAGAIDVTGKVVNFTTFNGSSGDDTITTAAANDVLNGLAGADSLLGGDGNDTLNGGTGNDTLAGGAGNDSLNGEADADVLEGGAGNDTLLGGAGADTLRGGANDDLYLVPIGDLAGDVFVELPGGGDDRIDLTSNSVTYDLTALSFTGIETLRASGFNTLVMTAAQINALTLIDGGFIFGNSSTLTLGAASAIDVTGKVVNFTTFNGSSGDDTITTAAANDVLNGLAGADSLLGGDGNDTLNGGIGNDTLAGGLGNDTLNGEADADVLDGGAGNDTLVGGAGADTLRGGANDDLYLFTLADLAGDVIEEAVGGGVDRVDFGNNSVAIDLTGLGLANVETLRVSGFNTLTLTVAQINGLTSIDGGFVFGASSTLTLGTSGAVDYSLGKAVNFTTYNGSSGDDTITGTAASETVAGQGGADSLLGGDGNDRVDGGAGIDVLSGGAGNDTLLGGSEADTLAGDAGDDSLSGDADGDVLEGGAGNDTLVGGAGGDTLRGGADNDVYVFTVADLPGDVIEEAVGGGIDRVDINNNSVAIDLTGLSLANIETLRVSGFNTLTLTVAQINALASIDGGFVFGASSTLTLGTAGAVNYSLGKAVNFTTYNGSSGDDTITATAANDTLNGQGGADSLLGGDGNDRVDGGAGNDVLAGGSGNDTLLGGSEADTLAGDAGDDSLNGEADGDVLEGGAGNDTLVGGAGADTLRGGADNDVYVFTVADLAGDVIEEAASGGIDRVDIGTNSVAIDLTGFSLANIETLRVSGFNTLTLTVAQMNALSSIDGGFVFGNTSTLTLGAAGAVDYSLGKAVNFTTFNGSSGDDTITGTTASETVAGQGGADSLLGGDGNDRVDGGAGNDVLAGGSGNDTLLGGSEADTLAGDAGDDSLSGEADADVLEGGAGNDTLVGGAGADTLRGGADNDVYVFTVADLPGDVIEEAASGGIDRVDIGTNSVAIDLTGFTLANIETLRVSGFNTLTLTAAQINGLALIDGGFVFGNTGTLTLGGPGAIDLTGKAVNFTSFNGSSGDDTITATAANDTLNGQGGADSLLGGDGNDTLNGGAGNDTLSGGLGNDRLDGGADINTASYAGAAGPVTVDLVAGSATGEGADTLIGILNAVGGSGNDSLVGNGSANLLAGGDGNDTLLGAGGDDTLDGGAGADSLVGGLGNDRYILNIATDRVLELFGEGADTIEASFNATLGDHIEALVLAGPAVTGTGNTLDNTILGNALGNALSGLVGNDTLQGADGNDTLQGGAGDDSLDGGIGRDSASYALATGPVTVNLGTGLATGEGADTLAGIEDVTGTAAADVLVGDGEANQLIGLGSADSLDGAGGADTLDGGEGNDTLNGGAGADLLRGGLGDDLYDVADAGDVASEAGGGGADTVVASVNFTLANGFEVLRLIGAATTGTGNGEANRIIGNALDNTLNGSGGNDTLLGDAGNDSLTGGANADSMAGGSGNDTYAVDDAGDVVIETLSGGDDGGQDEVRSFVSFTLGAFLETLLLSGSGVINGTGNNASNVITGNGANNVLTGLDGADTLDGGLGADTLVGGSGDDVFFVNDAGDVVTELGSGGTDLVFASVSFSLTPTLENLTLTGNAPIFGNGNGAANTLIGNTGGNRLNGGTNDDVIFGGGGADTLIGGSGADTTHGGTGNDRYTVDSLLDVVVELLNEGKDTVQSAVDLTLGDNLEVLQFSGTGDRAGTGNALANEITGTIGANLLQGLQGDDILTGLDGADTLIGGLGTDLLNGGAGSDRFVFGGLGEGIDRVLGFQTGADVLALSASGFGGVLAPGALDAANFVSHASSLATSAAGTPQFIYDTGGGALYFDIDGVGGTASQRFGTLAGAPTLLLADIVLIA